MILGAFVLFAALVLAWLAVPTQRAAKPVPLPTAIPVPQLRANEVAA